MNHILLKSKQEHWKWCYENYLRYYNELHPLIWSDKEQVILKPFFDWSKTCNTHNEMPDNVKVSFEYYLKARKNANNARKRIDFTRQVDREKLLSFFGFKEKTESDFNDEQEYESYLFSDNQRDLDIELSYPCIMVYHFSADSDRCGKICEMIVDYVELSEFAV